MRWVLALSVLATTAIMNVTRFEPAATFRAATSGRSRPVSLLAAAPRKPGPAVSDRATHAPSKPPRAKRIASRKSQLPPPSTAMLGTRAVARGVLIDETGMPVPSGEIRGMSWLRGYCSSRRSYGVAGYARNGIFVFRYVPPPLPPSLGPPREGGPKITFSAKARGFATEEFVAEPEIDAALRRGDSVEGLTIVLQRGAVVGGTVLGPDGRPAAGVDVGVVDDPLARRPEYRTREKTDEQGRFRLVDLDPRRTLWIYARSGKLLARPSPLEGLHADVVTHRTVTLERGRETDVRFEIDATDLNVWIAIDDNSRQAIVAGQYRVLLDSGAHHCKFTDANGDIVKTIRMWIEPYQGERYEMVRIDGRQE